MGWLISYSDTKKQTIARRTQTEVSEDGTRRWSYPKHSVRGNCLWKIAVIEDLRNGEWVEVFRCIALDLLRSGGKGMGWGYKDLDETMGPVETSCPISYLDMVPCPDSEYARAWRKAVREKAAGKQAVTDVIRAMKIGDRLYLKKGCQPEYVILTSKRPLQGRNGLNYKIPRRLVDAAKTRLFLT
jgi:hypothetical protein